jgi:DNA-binding IclR family transcriptional regulator
LILAFQQNAARARALAEWKRRTGRLLPRDLDRHLTRIHKRGYEEIPSYQVKGVTNIAFPVLNQQGDAIAALSVPFLTRIGDRIGPADVKAALRDASQKLSSALGGQRPLSGHRE